MASSQLLIVVAAAVAVWIGTAALRRFAIPTPVVLVVAGVVIGFLPFVPDATLEPHVVLLGLLPLLVFNASLSASPRAFLRAAPSIGLLAVGLVLLTAGVVAVAAHEVAQLSWPMAFVLGTAVGPTDAAAAVSVAGQLGLPRPLTTVLEGEALFNDATGLVLYAAAVTAATNGEFSAGHTALSLLYSLVVGTGTGLVVAVAGRKLLGRMDDPPMEIALALLIAYAAYLPAEALGASGVLGAVTAGLYLGWHASESSSRTRLQSQVFWSTLDFLLNAGLFILVGLSLHSFTKSTHIATGRLVLAGLAVVAAVVIVRLVWVALMSLALRPIRRLSGPHRHRREQVVLGWSGMRGALTLAAVLAVPEIGKDGHALSGRSDVVYLAFAVILVTLVGQGLTLPVLARRFRSGADQGIPDAERRARLEVLHAGRARLEAEARSGRLPDEVTDALEATYAARIRRLERPDADEEVESYERVLSDERTLRQELLAAERRRLLELRDQEGLGLNVLRRIERDLDLEEARLH
jgi:Na+/H+ antiporter